MKHLFTISLVFFSLTHLAKAEQRIDGLRVVTEVCCNRQQISPSQLLTAVQQIQDDNNLLFLTYSDLALGGVLVEEEVPTRHIANHIIAYLTIRHNAKNNSP